MLHSPDMRQHIAWQLAYRGMMHAKIAEATVWAKEEGKASEVKDVFVALQVGEQMHAGTQTCTYTYMCVHTHTHTYTHVHTCAHTPTHTYTRKHVRTCAHMHRVGQALSQELVNFYFPGRIIKVTLLLYGDVA